MNIGTAARAVELEFGDTGTNKVDRGVETDSTADRLRQCEPCFHRGVLDELPKYGMVNIRHAHGNWSSLLLAGWVEKIHPFAIRPMQKFAFTKGKNATDLG